jgi:phosphomannomutase
MNYIFDIDGTLTPSRLPIDKAFEEFFLIWMEDKDVFLVTGSDKDKTIEQVGEKIWTNCKRAYQSCGNAVYEKGELTRQLDFKLTPELKELLDKFLKITNWPYKYDINIEERIGLINFSTIGRKCPQNQRDDYHAWDKVNKERKTLCKIIEDRFPDLEATIGGQISIDIYPRGKNKAQVLQDIKGPVTFFGDKCKPGGNDFPIVERLGKLNEENNLSVTINEVKDWTETWEKLKGFMPGY